MEPGLRDRPDATALWPSDHRSELINGNGFLYRGQRSVTSPARCDSALINRTVIRSMWMPLGRRVS